jgi:threonine aldolase
MINMLSDTQTLPTEQMIEAITKVQLGDDVYGLDPSTKELERLAAEKMGKESAMFVPSGTMGNLCAIMAHTDRGDEVILEADSHIYYYETGGFALAGLSPRLVIGNKGVLDPDAVERALREPNIHYPKTSLLCIENTHNRAGGTITSPERTRELCDLAHEKGLKVHIDGARIFNAAVALGVNVTDLVGPADSVMFCLSKGLSCPVGSVLAGSKEFIDKARRVRKLLGGGMRQVGVLSAAGIVALETMIERLSEDHRNARVLAEGLSKLPGISIDMTTVQTNIVQFDVSQLGISAREFAALLKARGLLVSTRPPTRIRMVTHRHIESSHVADALQIVTQVINELN